LDNRCFNDISYVPITGVDNSNRLGDSGPGAIAVVAIGAALGWAFMRKRERI
jgi:hypothetical protein